jgi:LysM repeat protein
MDKLCILSKGISQRIMPAMCYIRKATLSLGLISLIMLAACTSPTSTPSPIVTERGYLAPYVTPSSSATVTFAAPRTTKPVIPTITPLPSPTPFIYTIKAGDTLGGLALRYGSTISDITAANPGIDPNILSIGITVTIPIIRPDVTPTVIPTPVPLAVKLAAPTCYATADGGAWCLVLASNPLPAAVENLSAWISLQAEGQTPGAMAYAPLNLLPPGAAIPLSHFFPAPLPETFTPQAELLTALPAVITTTRYITATVQVAELTITNLQADVSGLIAFNAAAPPAGLVALAAIAYDAADQPVGVAKWELAGDPLPASGVAFQVTVFSLGPAIARVEVFAEATPKIQSTAPE